MAPEQLRGQVELSSAGDQYGLGLVLYEMLAGHHPFGETPLERSSLARRQAGLPPLDRAKVPRALRRVCQRALALKAEDRYPDMDAMVRDLDAYLSSRLPALPPPARWRTALGGRRRSLALGVGLLAILGLGLGVWSGFTEERAHLHLDALQQNALDQRMELLLDAGEIAEADRVIRGWAAGHASLNPHAIASAWRRWGRTLLAAGQTEPALTALGEAFVHAADPRQRAMIRLDLAEAAFLRQDWMAAQASLAGLAVDDLPYASRDDGRRLIAALEISNRHFDRVDSSNIAKGWAPLVAVLAHATRLDTQAVDGLALGGDAPGLILLGADQPVVLRQLTGGPDGLVLGPATEIDSAGGPNARLAPWRDGRGSRFFFRDAEGVRLIELGPSGLIETTRWPWKWPSAAAVVDLNGDGVEEVYRAELRELWTAKPDELGAPWKAAHPPTDAANSEIQVVLSGDFDEDGRPELVLGLSGWGGYDIRVLEAGTDGLVLRGRRQLGSVIDVQPLRRDGKLLLAALQENDPEHLMDIRVFGPQAPHGGVRGVHLLRLQADGIEALDALPLPPNPVNPRAVGGIGQGDHLDRLVVGDLDGDGDDEVIVGQAGSIMRIYPGGGGEPLSLDALWPLAAVDLDQDGDDELIVSTLEAHSQVWVLGMGSGRLDVLPEGASEARPSPAGLDDASAARWAVAEDLLAVGAHGAALGLLRDLGRKELGRPAAGLAWLRVAEISEAWGDTDAALVAWQEAARVPAQAAAALEVSLQAALQTGRLSLARELARRSHDLAPSAAASAALHRLDAALDAPVRSLTFAHGIPPEIELLDPLDLRMDAAAGGMLVRAAGSRDLFSLPVSALDDLAELQIELSVGRLDWGSCVAVALDFEDGSSLPLVDWRGVGGGGLRWRVLNMLSLDGSLQLSERDHPGVATGQQLVSLTFDRVQSRIFVALTAADGRRIRKAVPWSAKDQGATPRALVLRSGRQDLGLSVAEITLRKMSLRGISVAERPHDPIDRALRALLRGDVVLARDAAKSGPPRSAALVALLARSGVEAAQGARLPDALSDDDLTRLLLLRPERMDVLPRPIVDPRGLRALHRAWVEGLRPDGRVDDMDRTMVAWLAGIERFPFQELRGPNDRLALLDLLTWRGAALRRTGDPAQARRTHDRARELSGLGDSYPSSGEHWRRIRWAGARLEVETADLDLGAGQPDDALRSLNRALERATAPEVLADQLAHRAELQGLHGTEGWQELMGQRQGPPPSAGR